jgi:hypothetical protein
VVEGVIPDRAGKVPARERRQLQTALTERWERFKENW